MPHPIATINPSLLQDPTGAFYSHISAVAPGAQLLYTAGQVGSDKNGKVPDSLEAQARQVYANIKTCLTEAGATIRNIVHLTTYIVDYDAASCPIWEAYKEFLTDQHGTYLPPGTLVPVSKLAAPDFKIEVQCVAAVNPPTPNTGTGVGKTVPSSTINVDVVVVGAGLSGLAAATEVQGAGLSCVVLEAKDRVGGKTQSVAMSQGPGVLDVGAAWINDTTQPKMYALHKKFGCEPLVQRTTGDQVFSEGKSNKISRVLGTDVLPLEEEQQRFFDQMWSDLDEDANKIDLYNSAANTHIPDISLGAYLRSKGGVGTALQMWTLSVRALTGCEPDDISLVYFLDYVKSGGGLGSLLTESSEGAQYLRNRNGNQTISIHLAQDLAPGTVRLGSAVTQITQTAGNCLVRTISGETFRCRKVLLSIPTPLYRHIAFTPPLPPAKQEITSATHLGAYSKCILVYAEPWWRKAGLSGSFCDLDGPIAFSRDVSSDEDGMFALACFLFGEYATKCSKLPPAQRLQVVKDQLAVMVGPELRHHVHATIQTIEKQWLPEQWVEGAPCPMVPPGGLWARLGNELRRPWRNLHFIGTETAYEWKGYMEGAVRAGERGAGEVIEAFRGVGPALAAKL